MLRLSKLRYGSILTLSYGHLFILVLAEQLGPITTFKNHWPDASSTAR